MRLTCPNCSARYEVDEAMVPPAGRDVQCSNCSQTWFQPGVRPAEDVAPDPVADDPVEAASASDTPAPEEESRPAEVDFDGASDAPGEDDTRPARREIDPNVADILREEAEREARLRRDDPAPDPQQEEMSLPEEASATRERRMAEFEDAEDAFDTDPIASAVASAADSRREQFPDIDEINSTLRATGDRKEGKADGTDVDTVSAASRRRWAVRRGFFSVLILAAIAVGIYVYAPQIAEAVPQAGPVLERYVDVVNSARFWLDDMARSLASGSDS